MRRLFLVVALLFPLSADAEDAKPACEAHELRPDELKQKLRRWRGLASFNRWRLSGVVPGECVLDGNVDVVLVLTPPARWSDHGVPYQVRTKIQVDASSGEPHAGRERRHKSLAASVRRLLQQAEAHEDVRRFLERFPPERADITLVGGTDRLQVDYRAASPATPGSESVPRLTYAEGFEPGVSAYELPRMDSLPARRELLRFVETLSQHHPHCRPAWISVHWKALPPPPAGENGAKANGSRSNGNWGRWEIDLRLAGDNCPARFQGAVLPDRTVVEVYAPRPPAPSP